MNYPLIISGKPLFSLPANIPVIFELTILFSALATFGALFALNNLPEWYHPVFTSKTFRRVTTNRFFIAIEAIDPKFDSVQTREFLDRLGGISLEQVED